MPLHYLKSNWKTDWQPVEKDLFHFYILWLAIYVFHQSRWQSQDRQKCHCWGSLRACKLSIWGISWKVDAREASERRRERGDGGEKGELATVTYKFSFPPRETPGHRKACKLSPQTCPRLEKWQPPVKFKQPRTRRIYLFIINRFRNSYPLHQSSFFDNWYDFLSTEHRTSTCPLG